jgi:hypothetical protein
MLSEKCSLERNTGIPRHLIFSVRLLKNRKSARKSRKRRKAEVGSLKDEIKALKEENTRLKRQIKEYEKNKDSKDSSNKKASLEEEKHSPKKSAIKETPAPVAQAEIVADNKNENTSSNIIKPQPLNPLHQLLLLPTQLASSWQNYQLSQLPPLPQTNWGQQIKPTENQTP